MKCHQSSCIFSELYSYTGEGKLDRSPATDSEVPWDANVGDHTSLVNEQILALRHITSKLERAYNGLDVQWDDGMLSQCCFICHLLYMPFSNFIISNFLSYFSELFQNTRKQTCIYIHMHPKFMLLIEFISKCQHAIAFIFTLCSSSMAKKI